MCNRNILLSSYDNISCDIGNSVFIDKLENYIIRCNKAMLKGEGLVSVSVYNTLIDYLKELNSESGVLNTVYSIDDSSVDFSNELDINLKSNPMLPLKEVSNVKDVAIKQFKNKLYNYPTDVLCSIKLKGEPIRIVYKDGVIVKATVRGKYGRGKDITSQVITILGKKNSSLRGRGLVELRGDIILPITNLEKAKEYNKGVKNIHNGLVSLLKDGVSDKEVRLLDIVITDILGDGFMFDNLTGKYQFIERAGFETPLAFIDKVERFSFEDDIVRIIGKMEAYIEDYKYNTDGVVLSIDDLELHSRFGVVDNSSLGSLLLKLGQWRQESYKGVIKEIKWLDKGAKKTPVAILKDAIQIEEGIVIDRVPLYAPCYILMLEAYEGNTLHFRYAGRYGVIPTTVDGNLVVDKLENKGCV